MGIRVNKIIGYGVTDLAEKDPRVDWENLYSENSKLYEQDSKGFLEWCERNIDKIEELWAAENPGDSNGIDPSPKEIGLSFKRWHFELLKKTLNNKKFKKSRPYNWVEFDDESDDNTIVLLAPEYPHWKRYDDIIDWVEETQLYKQKNRVVKLDHLGGIHPYNNIMIRVNNPPEGLYRKYVEIQSKTGHCADKHGYTMLTIQNYNRLVGRWSENVKPIAQGDALNHFLNDWRPQIPATICALIAWLDCFSTDFIRDIRPLMYVCWR